MFDFWENDLTEEETQACLDKCANEITKRKLETPAILFLEMHKPLSNVFAHGGMMSAPFLVPFLGFDLVNDYSNLLRDKNNVERLICMLEESRAGTPSREELCH